MKAMGDTVRLSASDLVGHLNCLSLTALDLEVVRQQREPPKDWDPLLEILRERGRRHEQAFVEHLTSRGMAPVLIEGVDITDDSVAATHAAMRAGAELVLQGALAYGRWAGRLDVLKRVETSSDLGAWSYEVIDTKLARETKGGTVLQLCLYADLLREAQGIAPEFVYVVAPWSDFEPQAFRYASLSAYFRRVKRAAEEATSAEKPPVYPEPVPHCDVCRWSRTCESRWRDDDHLSLVANASRLQRQELERQGIDTVDKLGHTALPLPFKPTRGTSASLEKLVLQAAIQLEGRNAGEPRFELLPVEAGRGLAALPPPSEGDLFFDIESDAFVGVHGIEYLLGYGYFDAAGGWHYDGAWGLDRRSERSSFEAFVDLVVARRERFPDLHIYHFAPYEPGALKRLMGRYGTREAEIDQLLRGHVFVDLLSVVREGLRASVESYSLKKLEPFYEFERQVDLRDANIALTRFSAGIELDDAQSITEETRETVKRYNEDDCRSTAALRGWLEALRRQCDDQGDPIPRPDPPTDQPSEALTEHQERIQALIAQLINDVPDDVDDRTAEQHARWLLAQLLEWHRREEKVLWWEYFRLAALPADELLDERQAISGLTLQAQVSQSKTGIPTHRYNFPTQETELRGGEDLRAAGGEKLGKCMEVSSGTLTIDITKSRATSDVHPEAVFAHKVISTKEQAGALVRMAEHVIAGGVEGPGRFAAGRALLLRASPEAGGAPLREHGELVVDAVRRLASQLCPGILPVQGPPGTGKTYTAGRMICQLVHEGRKVGVTANSHKVILNVLAEAIKAAREEGLSLRAIHKGEPDEQLKDIEELTFTNQNPDAFTAIKAGKAQLAGGTPFFWSREEAENSVDVLFVDEAAQVSLANALAVSGAAPVIVLLGDPQQLDQPTQGSHPDGTDGSALSHLLGDQPTIRPSQGLFLETTWRLHPSVCTFISEQFYAGELDSVAGTEQQLLHGDALAGSGLRYLPVVHEGNMSSSPEEADAVTRLVELILSAGTLWTDRDGRTKPVTIDDILIIAPYNAQVFEIQQCLPTARVGTVDKFQGQEAPIAIYSMATSSHSEAPRGMDFLYSANRFNVAISRAKCMAILVASPSIFEAECRTPEQMRLANAFCRFLELAEELSI